MNQTEKTYSEIEVKQLVRDAISNIVTACMEWTENETVVIDKTTKQEITNCELTIKPDAKKLFENYIVPELKKQGINFTLE